jgi:hypothetical protein
MVRRQQPVPLTARQPRLYEHTSWVRQHNMGQARPGQATKHGTDTLWGSRGTNTWVGDEMLQGRHSTGRTRCRSVQSAGWMHMQQQHPTSSLSSRAAHSARSLCLLGSRAPVGRQYMRALGPCAYSRINVTWWAVQQEYESGTAAVHTPKQETFVSCKLGLAEALPSWPLARGSHCSGTTDLDPNF